MSTLKTHNLQSPDAGSVNIAMTPNAGMIVAGLSTYSNQINVGNNIQLGTAGVVTATSFVGSGANLTNLPVPTTITVADESSDTTCNPLFVTTTSGNLAPKTGTNLTFNSASGNLRTGSLFVGTATNESKTQDGLILERNSADGAVHISAGRSGGNYGQMQFYVAGASGVTKRHQIDYQSNFRWYGADGTTERLRIDNNGNARFGPGGTIGNYTNYTTLVIANTAGGDLEFRDSGNNNLIGDLIGAEGSGMYLSTRQDTPIVFRTGASLSEKVRITSGGDLRLGLDSVANATDSAHFIMTLTGKSGQTGAGAIAFKDPSANTDGFIFADSGNLFITADYSNATADSSIRFRVDGSSEKLRITSGGQVGMGQDGSGNVQTRAVLELCAPFNDVSDNDGSADYTMNNHDALLINFSGASYSSGTNVGSIAWTNGGRRRAAIMGEYQHTDGDYLALSFFTRGSDGANDFYRSFIINHNGSAGLHGALSQSTSDDRLKKDKVEITNALDKVNSLSSFTHKWNDIAVRAGLEENKEEIGLSAQEVQGLYPCLVDVNNVMKDPEDPDTDYLTVHYAKVVPLLVASIKELTAKNKALEARLDALEGS